MQEPKEAYTITLDDDPVMARIIEQATGLESISFMSTSKLLAKASSLEPQAVFVDVHLGVDDSGLDVLPKLREFWPNVVLLVITGDPNDALVGESLAAGANDFVRKPINAEEVRGRLRARIAEMAARRRIDELRFGTLVYSRSKGSIENAGMREYLPRLQAKLFEILWENRGAVVARSEIKVRMWGRVKVADNTLDKKVSNLRHLLGRINSGVT